MTTFGDALRKFRQASNDPERLNRRLSQERLGEMIGREFNNWGYTGAAISEWELGKSRISGDDRAILLALVGPLWAFFFLEYYSTLLNPTLGILVILLALSAVVLFARKRSQK